MPLLGEADLNSEGKYGTGWGAESQCRRTQAGRAALGVRSNVAKNLLDCAHPHSIVLDGSPCDVDVLALQVMACSINRSDFSASIPSASPEKDVVPCAAQYHAGELPRDGSSERSIPAAGIGGR